MSVTSTRSKVIVTVTGSYIATAMNIVTAYISLLVLGPELIGLYQAFLLIRNYAVYANLGEVESIRKQGAILWARGEHDELQQYQDQTLTVALLTICVVVATIGVVGVVQLKPTGLKALTFATVLVLFGIQYVDNAFENCLSARNEFELRARGGILYAAVALVSLLLILPFHYVGFLLGRVVAGIVAVLYFHRVLHYRVRLTRHITEFRTMVKTGLPMSIIGFLLAYFVTADRLVVVHRLGTLQMGIYSIVPMIGVPLALFVQGTSTVLFTRSSHLLGTRTSLKAIVEDAAVFTRSGDRFAPQLVCVLIFFLPLVITLMLPRYEGAIAAAQIAVLGYCFYGMASPFANLFIVLDRPRLFVAILLASGSAIVVLGNVGVAAGHGLAGVAVGSAVGCFVYSLSTMYFPLRWAGHGIVDTLGLLVRQIQYTLTFMGLAAVILLIIRAFAVRWVLVSTIVGVVFAIGSAPTLARVLRKAVQYSSGLSLPGKAAVPSSALEITTLQPGSVCGTDVTARPTSGLT